RPHTRCSRDWSSDVCSSDLDGVPQSNPLRDGRRDGFTIDMEAIERVEVIFGANAIQGLGATGGIVNYVTVSPPVTGELMQRASRSEERRVGKGCRPRWTQPH